MKVIREKKHRLENGFYTGEKVVSFVACIKNRQSVFIEKHIFTEFEKILLKEIRKFQCEAFIYLFMPDHLHLVQQGNNRNSDVVKAIDMFKQKTGFWLYKNKNQIKWQKDYHDHIIRSDEDLKGHIYYILNNPVRAGLVGNWKEYQFKGSTIYNFDEWG